MTGARRSWVAIGLALQALSCATSSSEVASEPRAEQVPEGRLPEGVKPTSYRISLEVIPERDTFKGSAMISVEIDTPSSVIWMHGERLDVSAIHATHATTTVPAGWKQVTANGVARVDLAEPLPAGRSTLHVEYEAPFDTPLRGLYRVRSGGETYAFTQFEAISARLAFPCFDEPRFKTPFELTLTVPEDEFAAANTPVDRAIPLGDGLQRISFLPTPPLPTYLVAFAVGPFDVVTGEQIPPSPHRPYPVPLRGLAVRGKGTQLTYALDRTAGFLGALEAYFGMAYPYRKLDIVAVPDFAAGAMENVGLITFREWLLLLEPARATEGQRRAFAYVMAHELAHQWFGNLVTMPWWNDIWLNEAFATWMGNKVVHRLHPEYRSDLAELSSTHRAMALDSLSGARSIQQPVVSNHDIKNAFDVITYEKGGAVLGMFEHWMGAETFQTGIRRYLGRHQGGTATSTDLVTALDAASERDVAPPFLTFLTQPGAPVLTATSRDEGCSGGMRVLDLEQERYLPIGSPGDPRRAWQVPMCIRHSTGVTCTLLSERTGTVELPGCPEWWMLNDSGAGYFRFSMPREDWSRLRSRGFLSLSERGRIATADSLFAAFDRGSIDVEAVLEWLPGLSRSDVRQLALGPMELLRFLMNDGSSAELRPNVKRYSKRLYRRRYQRLGWQARAKDSSDLKLLREEIIRFMVMDVRDEGARARAARLGRKVVGYGVPADPKAVEMQLVGVALAAAVQESDPAFFDHLLEELDGTTDATSRYRILVALGHAEEPTLSERALQLALDPNLRRNEVSRTLGAQFRNPRTRGRAWSWLQDNFDALVERAGASQAGALPWYTTSMCSREEAEAVRAFFEPRIGRLDGGPRNLAYAVEAIELCAAKVARHRADVDRAFAARPAKRL